MGVRVGGSSLFQTKTVKEIHAIICGKCCSLKHIGIRYYVYKGL